MSSSTRATAPDHDPAPDAPDSGGASGAAVVPGAPTPAEAGEQPEVAELLPLLSTLADGLPPVVDTPEALERAADALAAGSGPVAVDAERASGYRYGQDAQLVQLRRAGSGT